MKRYGLPSFSIASLAVMLFLSACGGGGDAPATEAPSPTESLTPDQSITITANDRMEFAPTRFEVNAGEVLELTLDNVGRMPKVSMGHNIVILQLGTDPGQYANAAARHPGEDYMPSQWRGSVVAATAMLGGGEQDTIVFRVPDRPGEYPFVCSFPGHFPAGMRGVMVVR